MQKLTAWLQVVTLKWRKTTPGRQQQTQRRGEVLRNFSPLYFSLWNSPFISHTGVVKISTHANTFCGSAEQAQTATLYCQFSLLHTQTRRLWRLQWHRESNSTANHSERVASGAFLFVGETHPLCGMWVWTENGEVYPVGLPLAVYNTGSIHTRWMIAENQTGVGN